MSDQQQQTRRHRWPNAFQMALRETWCWLRGHQWKHSWRKVSEEERPDLQRRNGNPYFDYVSSWHAKCRRCRLATRDATWYPWYRSLWWAANQFFGCLRIGIECAGPWADYRKRREGHGYTTIRWPGVIYGLLAAPCFAVEQTWFGWCWYQWHMPAFPGSIAMKLHMWFNDRAEKYETRWYWKPPYDPMNPHMVGCWSTDKDQPYSFVEVYHGGGFNYASGEPSVEVGGVKPPQ
jgi:hypothetical protein